jgi:8-oxo-dGTP pyrophosphatase MutT (NUDIX family)
MMAIFPDGSLAMAVNQRRGPEVPGGHIDPGETAEDAAVREASEETGIAVDNVRPIGFLRMVSAGVAPPDWKYPHPVGFQQFFAGAAHESAKPYRANSECAEPIRVTREMAVRPDSPLDAGQRAFYEAAHQAVLGCTPREAMERIAREGAGPGLR